MAGVVLTLLTGLLTMGTMVSGMMVTTMVVTEGVYETDVQDNLCPMTNVGSAHCVGDCKNRM